MDFQAALRTKLMVQIDYFNQFYVIKMAKTKVKELWCFMCFYIVINCGLISHEYQWATTNTFVQPLRSSRHVTFGNTPDTQIWKTETEKHHLFTEDSKSNSLILCASSQCTWRGEVQPPNDVKVNCSRPKKCSFYQLSTVILHKSWVLMYKPECIYFLKIPLFCKWINIKWYRTLSILYCLSVVESFNVRFCP